MLWYFITASYSPLPDNRAQPKFNLGPFYADDATARDVARGFLLASQEKDRQIASTVTYLFSQGDLINTKGWITRELYEAELVRLHA